MTTLCKLYLYRVSLTAYIQVVIYSDKMTSELSVKSFSVVLYASV